MIYSAPLFFFHQEWKMIRRLEKWKGMWYIYKSIVGRKNRWKQKGEKVIKCDIGYEAAREYVETHNSKKALKYIDIYPNGGMSDIAIYNSECDKEFLKQPDWGNDIVISYLRKILWW